MDEPSDLPEGLDNPSEPSEALDKPSNSSEKNGQAKQFIGKKWTSQAIHRKKWTSQAEGYLASFLFRFSWPQLHILLRSHLCHKKAQFRFNAFPAGVIGKNLSKRVERLQTTP